MNEQELAIVTAAVLEGRLRRHANALFEGFPFQLYIPSSPDSEPHLFSVSLDEAIESLKHGHLTLIFNGDQ